VPSSFPQNDRVLSCNSITWKRHCHSGQAGGASATRNPGIQKEKSIFPKDLSYFLRQVCRKTPGRTH